MRWPATSDDDVEAGGCVYGVVLRLCVCTGGRWQCSGGAISESVVFVAGTVGIGL